MISKNYKLIMNILLICLVMLFPLVASASENQLIVSNTSEFKKALENPEGSNIKLGANIKFPASLRVDYAVEITDGDHVIDLNGFSIEYYFVNSDKENSGTPINICRGSLTINGLGTIKGGTYGLELCGDATLVVNSGHIIGLAACAIRVQGVAIINGGSLTGRFGEIFMEDGLLVDYAGIVKKINKAFQQAAASIVQNGKLKGNAIVRSSAILNNMEIPVGSSITVTKNAILDIRGNLIGEERIKVEDGMLIKKGIAVFNKDTTLIRNFTFNGVVVESSVRLIINRDTKLIVKGNLTNNGILDIENSILIVEGDLINSGKIRSSSNNNLIVKGKLINNGEIDQPGSNQGPNQPQHNDNSMADKLYVLGLFQGSGKDSFGNPIYDLDIKPTRQVAITMLVRLLGKEKEVIGKEYNHPFEDVDDWANPYVGYAYENGLTKGVSSTMFGGKDLVTCGQYLTFVLRALGYSEIEGDFSWKNPILLTDEIGLTNENYRADSDNFDRREVVNISERALHQNIKGSNINLLQNLVDIGAIRMEDVYKVGMGHLLE